MRAERLEMEKTIIVITPNTPSLHWFRMDMMCDFIKRGYRVVAVGQQPVAEWKEEFAQYGIGYRAIPIHRNSLNPFRDIRTLRAIRALYEELHPEKVFLYQAKAVAYGSMAAANKPYIQVYSLISGLGSVFRAQALKQKMLRIFMKYLYRYALKRNAAVIFHNAEDMAQFIQWKIVRRSICRIVHGSGVNTAWFAYKEAPSETVVFLMISRLIRDKGIMEYLKACRLIRQKYPDVKCMLVGAFDTNPSAIRKEDLEKYLPYIDYQGEQEDVRPFIEKCTTYVLPSYHEGVPKTVLEAMSVGRAVITTDAPGCRETVEDGENGFLVPVKNVHALVQRMEYMVLHPQEQQRMGCISRKYAEEKYDVQKINKEIAKIMELKCQE